MSLEIDWDRLQEFKNHYRGLASYQNHKLVRIRTLLGEIHKRPEFPFYVVTDEEMKILRDLCKPELYKIPTEAAMQIDQMLEAL